jgi:hypothetical protein
MCLFYVISKDSVLRSGVELRQNCSCGSLLLSTNEHTFDLAASGEVRPLVADEL